MPNSHWSPPEIVDSRFPPPLRWAALLSLLFVACFFLPFPQRFNTAANYLPIHTGLELLAIIVSAMVITLAWNLREQPNNSYSLLLGAGFLATGLIDGMHILSYTGMPDLVTPSGPEKTINFWLAGRYVAAGTFLAVAFLPIKSWSTRACETAVLLALIGSATVWWIGLYHSEWLPHTYLAEQGLTQFKIGAEYLLAFLYALAALRLYLKSRQTSDQDLLWLATAAWAQALAELFFTRYIDLADTFNLLGHIYKAIAYTLVYRALFVAGIQAPYRALSRQRAQLQTLLATIPDLVWLKNPAGVFLACNTRFERLYGASSAQIIGKTDYDFVDREQADFFRAYDLQAMNGQTTLINEECLTFADDGHQELTETTKTPMLDDQGQLIGVLGIGHNITARDQAEKALRDREQRFRNFANASPTLFWTSGLDKHYDWVNQRWLEFTGRAIEQELGKGWTDGVHADDIERQQAIYSQSFDARQAFSIEYRLRRHDGEFRWLLDRGLPRNDADGHFIGYIGSCLDITEERNLRNKLAASEAHYRHLFEHNPAPMLIYQLDNLQLEAVNQAFLHHYDYSQTEALALCLPDLYPAEEQGAIAELSAPVHEQNAVNEWHHLNKAGQLLSVVTHCHDLQFHDKPCRVVVINDISAIKQAEQTLRQRNAELEQFNTAAVGREIKMIELKGEINELSRQLGQAAPYDLDFSKKPAAEDAA